MQRHWTKQLKSLYHFAISGEPVPTYLNYQGKLIDGSTGQPIPDDAHNVTFRICDNGTSGGVVRC